jgi:type VI secretion system secreted protein VgrG
VPEKLPDTKTVSMWKSDSSLGSDGYNQLRYEDKAGDELFRVQAEKNLRKLVKHDETITVLHDREKHIQNCELDTTGVNRTEVTGVDRTETTKSNRLTFIGKDRGKWVKVDELERTECDRQVRVGKNASLVVGGRKRDKVFGEVHLHVQGKRSESVEGKQSLTLFADQQEKVDGSHALATGQAIHFLAGEDLVGEGVSSVTFKGPGGFVHIDAGGVTIKGTIVDINVGGSPGDGVVSSPEPPDEPVPIHLVMEITPKFAEVAVPVLPGDDGREDYPPQHGKITLRSNKGYSRTLSLSEGVRKDDGFCSFRFYGMDDSMQSHLFTATIRGKDHTETLFEDCRLYTYVEHAEKKGDYEVARGSAIQSRRGG